MLDSLPYLIKLIQHNILLHALVTTGSFQGIDLSLIKHDIKSSSAIEFFDFELSKDDIFYEVLFYVTLDSSSSNRNSIRHLVFTTDESKYFEQSSFYFNDDHNRGKNKHPLVRKMRTTQKDLGVFNLFDKPTPPAIVSIVKNPGYGYSIFLDFYSNYIEVIKRREELDKAFENDSISGKLNE